MKYPRNKKSKKPSMAAAKKMVTKLHKAKAKKNMDTFFLKTKDTVTITPSQGGTVSNYIFRCYTMDVVNGGGNQTCLFLQNAEFNLWKLYYDKFRVNSVKVTCVPKANVLDQTNAQNDTTYNNQGDGLVHTCIDRDGQAPSSKASITRYPSYRKYSILKPFSRSYSIRYPTGVWLDCQQPSAFANMNTVLGLSGGITIYAEGILEDNLEVLNEPWATVTVEYNIVFQGKTSANLSAVRDASDNLIGVSVIRNDPDAQLSLTPQTNVTGSLEQDTKTVVALSGEPPELTVIEVPVNDAGVPL